MPDYSASICFEDYPQTYSFRVKTSTFPISLCLGTLTLKHALCSSGYASSFIAYSPLSKQKAQARVIPVLSPLLIRKITVGIFCYSRLQSCLTLSFLAGGRLRTRTVCFLQTALPYLSYSDILMPLLTVGANRALTPSLNGRGKPRINAPVLPTSTNRVARSPSTATGQLLLKYQLFD